MYDDDHDALAAEYVLGTLSADERDQADALARIDPGFAEVVRQWERRLGELHVMVESVEPPPPVWEKIRQAISALPKAEPEAPRVEKPAADTPQPEKLAADMLHAVNPAPQPSRPVEPPKPPETPDPTSPIAALASSLLPPDPELAAPKPSPGLSDRLLPPTPITKEVGRSAEVVYLARRVRHWRRLTAGLATLAALLALYIAVWQVAPGLIPAPLQPHSGGLLARTTVPSAAQGERLVAVLQHEPTAPAFLVMLDPQSRSLTVRRVAATPEAGRSYELWLISSRFPAPRSLGVVGNEEFTQRVIPANYDLDTLRGASYAVSLEPAGGSPSGAPTGPVLFTGKAVEASPRANPPA